MAPVDSYDTSVNQNTMSANESPHSFPNHYGSQGGGNLINGSLAPSGYFTNGQWLVNGHVSTDAGTSTSAPSISGEQLAASPSLFVEPNRLYQAHQMSQNASQNSAIDPNQPPFVRSAAPEPQDDRVAIAAYDTQIREFQELGDGVHYVKFTEQFNDIIRSVISETQPTILDHAEMTKVSDHLLAPNDQRIRKLIEAFDKEDTDMLTRRLIRLTGAMKAFTRLRVMYTAAADLNLLRNELEDALLFADIVIPRLSKLTNDLFKPLTGDLPGGIIV